MLTSISIICLALCVVVQVGRNAVTSNQMSRIESRIVVLEHRLVRLMAERGANE